MQKYFTLLVILSVGIIGCTPDDPTAGQSFPISEGSEYSVYLGGSTSDTSVYTNYPNRQITHAIGRKQLRGRLEVTEVYNDLYFDGYIYWEDVRESGSAVIRTKTNGIWDTTYTNTPDHFTSLSDSSIFITGKHTPQYLSLTRDTVAILYHKKTLEFTILKFDDREMRSFAGYPEIRTTYTGHPDSTSSLYHRHLWSLDTIRIEPK